MKPEALGSFRIYGKVTLLELALMEAFVVAATLVAWLFVGALASCLIVFQGLIFLGWWFGRRRLDAKGGFARISRYFEQRRQGPNSPKT